MELPNIMLTPEQKETVLSICEAYEAGYQAAYKSDINPFYINDMEYFAWEVGHTNGINEKDIN